MARTPLPSSLAEGRLWYGTTIGADDERTNSPTLSPQRALTPNSSATVVPTIRGYSTAEFAGILWDSKSKPRLKPDHLRTIVLWMKKHSVRAKGVKNPHFKELLDSLGFTESLCSEILSRRLFKKVQYRVSRFGRKFVGDGTITVGTTGSKGVCKFADWTDTWLSPTWDGNTDRPVAVESEDQGGDEGEGEEDGGDEEEDEEESEDDEDDEEEDSVY